LARDSEQRSEQRVAAALPVTLDRGTGITENVSASGVFFETDASYAPASPVHFTLEIDTPGGPILLDCHGTIVRVERRQGRLGVAAKITESVIRPARSRSAGAAPT
jgi:hypothetical protein